MLALLLFACSGPMPITAVTVDVSNPGSDPARFEVGPLGTRFRHTQRVTANLELPATDIRPGRRSLTLKLSDQRMLIEDGDQALDLPLKVFGAPLALGADDLWTPKIEILWPIDVAVPEAMHAQLRQRCGDDISLEHHGQWTMPGFEDPAQGWRMASATGPLTSMFGSFTASVSCGLPPADPKAPPIPLLQSTGPDQVRVLGGIRGMQFSPDVLIRPGPVRTASVVASDLPPSELDGTLTGETRWECDQLFARGQGVYHGSPGLLVGGTHPLQPRPVTEIEAPEPSAVPGEGRSVSAYGSSYQVDLDGDGTLEIIVPTEVAVGDPDTPSHSFVEVRSGPHRHRVGFMDDDPPGGRNLKGAEDQWASLDAIVDLDGDGRMELIVTHHNYGWHYHEIVVYHWSPQGFWVLGSDITGERDCYAEDRWKR